MMQRIFQHLTIKIMVSMDPYKEYNEIKDLIEQIESCGTFSR